MLMKFNIIETLEELSKVVECLKKDFEIKDRSKTKFYFDLQV